MNRSLTFDAGSSQDRPATHTGTTGPRLTTPARVPRGAVAWAAAARARARLDTSTTTSTTTRIAIHRVDAKRGPALRPALSIQLTTCRLRGELADPRSPVRERCAVTGAVVRATARAEQVVTGPAEERAAPRGVIA